MISAWENMHNRKRLHLLQFTNSEDGSSDIYSYKCNNINNIITVCAIHMHKNLTFHILPY